MSKPVSYTRTMNSPRFPWQQLSFAFIFFLILGFIYLPIQLIPRSLPWFVWIIALLLAALVYAISESMFTALLKNLEIFLGSFLALIVVALIFVSGTGVGFLLFNLLTTLIKSK